MFSMDNRCLEEGAEEFIVKPVKLSDVRRLRDFIMRGEENWKKGNNHKRKLQDDYGMSPPLSPAPSLALDCEISSLLLPSSSSSSSPECRPSKRPRLWVED